MVCWVSTTFTYYIVIFLVKYLPGSLYINQLVSGFACIGYLVTPPLAKKLDNRKIMLLGYVVTLVFLVGMLIAENSHISDVGYSFVFFLFKCGVSMVNISLFVIHYDLFPTKYMATSYGLCNIISRILTIAGPIVAELGTTIPVIILIILNALALIAAYFLRMNKTE